MSASRKRSGYSAQLPTRAFLRTFQYLGWEHVNSHYFLINPICFAIAPSTIRVGSNLGTVQFLKR
jgi:hypothetical protein